jgi:hypothetical protein
MNIKATTTRKIWTDEDVYSLLTVYDAFLKHQFANEAYTKAATVRALAELQGRSKGSIECKMMNVSAVLSDGGGDYVTGYKPLRNYNKALRDQVERFYNAQ